MLLANYKGIRADCQKESEDKTTGVSLDRREQLSQKFRALLDSERAASTIECPLDEGTNRDR
jgi:hypothetical protein